ncbi:hypothetical protein HHI36_021790 [Cryptolaemus montrouzieri]|uniref:Uncharacterized protein n=1 Tax=Cryptolaemus montrouzieri TaxID=559131 RepID=A0ABD2MYQ6_9CUCU
MKKASGTNFDQADSDRLFVRGVTLNPIRLPVSDRTKWGVRNVKLHSEDQGNSIRPKTVSYTSEKTGKRSRNVEKKALLLNVVDCGSSGVRNGLLRQIHETVEISDFRRLLSKLIKFRVNREDKRASDALIARMNVSAIHAETNAYMNVLEKLAETFENQSESEVESTVIG